GEWSQDLSLIREFRLKGKLRFQLRGEAFNVFNHTNFNGPNVELNVIATTVNGQDAAVFNSPNFGLITSAKAPRFLQLVARIEFRICCINWRKHLAVPTSNNKTTSNRLKPTEVSLCQSAWLFAS